jgi:hypothetical protein
MDMESDEAILVTGERFHLQHRRFGVCSVGGIPTACSLTTPRVKLKVAARSLRGPHPPLPTTDYDQ